MDTQSGGEATATSPAATAASGAREHRGVPLRTRLEMENASPAHQVSTPRKKLVARKKAVKSPQPKKPRPAKEAAAQAEAAPLLSPSPEPEPESGQGQGKGEGGLSATGSAGASLSKAKAKALKTPKKGDASTSYLGI